VSEPAVVVECPAKINIYLRVVRRREDGYHELDTLFQAIDLRDRLEVSPAAGLSMTCDQAGLPVDGGNLVLRAARALRERCGIAGDIGARFHLHKAIPVGGGLGGGSSDAAGALIGCARLWEIGSDRALLEEVAGGIGADVPFFLTGGTARGRGRGDRIEPLPALGELPVLLGAPPFGISTAEVFRRVRERLTLPGNGVNFPIPLAHKWPKENDFSFMVNDLEQVVFDGWDELKRFRDALSDAGARRALLSGSGSTVYGIFAGREQAAAARDRLASRFGEWRLTLTRTVDTAVRIVTAGGVTGGRQGES